MQICIFEDKKANNFYPLTLSRPVWEMRCGIFTLAQKIIKYQPRASYCYHCRKYLQPMAKKQNFKLFIQKKNSEATLFINGRVVADKNFLQTVTKTKTDAVFYVRQELVAAYLTKENLALINNTDNYFSLQENKLKKIQVKVKLANYIWDLVNGNSEQIISDAKSFSLGKIAGQVYPGAYLINKKNIFIGQGSKIMPGAVINAEDGPVVIEEKTEVMPNSVIIGPVYIGPQSKIKVGAKIYEGTSIGSVCKVGGEVEESIILDYSNKQHDGFLGHAYIGSWCNLGANTNNSDLKNNYSNVDIIFDGKNKINTGLTFVGLFMGDHSKSGINTMFNTGTTVGFSSNIFGAGYLPKYIPSFSWLEAGKNEMSYQLDKAMVTAGKVMARRRIKFSKADKNLFIYLFNSIK
ncbi:MAG: GlmU family protein [bacterium]|nr:GlmU family protein [bacterium]